MLVPMRTSNECSSAVVLESSSQAAALAALSSSDKLESAEIRWRTMIIVVSFDLDDGRCNTVCLLQRERGWIYLMY